MNPNPQIDTEGGKMYFLDHNPSTETGSVHRANLDGSDVEPLVTSGLDFPSFIVLDLDRREML